MNPTLLFIKANWKTIVIIILIIIALIIIYRNWYKIKRLFQPRNINLETGENISISPERKLFIENLASLIYKDIYDTPASGHTTELYNQANALTDNELLYLSRYYKRQLSSGEWLYDDIDDEVFSWGNNSDTNLLAHLAKIGER